MFGESRQFTTILPSFFFLSFSSVATEKFFFEINKNIYTREIDMVCTHRLCAPLLSTNNLLFFFFCIYIRILQSLPQLSHHIQIKSLSRVQQHSQYNWNRYNLLFYFFFSQILLVFYHIITSMVGHCFTKLFHKVSFDTYIYIGHIYTYFCICKIKKNVTFILFENSSIF